MKFALITGATSGIGYELAKLFAKNEYGLILVSSSQDHLDNVKKKLQGHYSTPIYVIEQDLTQIGAAYEVYQKVTKEQVPVTVLVNIAGFGIVGATNEIDLKQD